MGPSVLSAASSFPLLDPVDLRSFLEVFCFLALGSVSDMVDDCGVYLALGSLCCWLLVQLGLRFTLGVVDGVFLVDAVDVGMLNQARRITRNQYKL